MSDDAYIPAGRREHYKHVLHHHPKRDEIFAESIKLGTGDPRNAHVAKLIDSHAVLDSVAQELADALRYCLKHLSPMLTGLSPDGPREGVLDALVALERFDNLNKKAGTE